MLLIKEKTGVTNSRAFQQLPEETKRSVLIELKGMRASLRQLERLTESGKVWLLCVSPHLYEWCSSSVVHYQGGSLHQQGVCQYDDRHIQRVDALPTFPWLERWTGRIMELS